MPFINRGEVLSISTMQTPTPAFQAFMNMFLVRLAELKAQGAALAQSMGLTSDAKASRAMTQLFNARKGQATVSALTDNGIQFIILGILLSFGILFVSRTRDQMTTDAAREGATSTIEALTTFTGWMPMIALAIVAVLVISYFLIFRRNRGSRKGKRGRA